MGPRMNDRPLWHPDNEIDDLCDTMRVSELLADQTAFISRLTDAQKANLIGSMHTILFGWPRRQLTDPQQVYMLRDEFENMAMEVLGL